MAVGSPKVRKGGVSVRPVMSSGGRAVKEAGKMAKKSYTAREVSEELGVEYRTLGRWEKSGKFPAPRRDTRRNRLYTETDMDRLKELQREIKPGRLFRWESGAPRKLLGLGKRFCEGIEASSRTTTRYLSSLRKLYEWLCYSEKGFDELTPQDGEDFIKWLGKRYDHETAKEVIMRLLRFYDFLVAQDRIFQNPFRPADISAVSGSKGLGRLLDSLEYVLGWDERTRRLFDYLLDGATYAEIGVRFDLTRARVEQILSREVGRLREIGERLRRGEVRTGRERRGRRARTRIAASES